jgi:STE24 endopeptidase
MLQKGEEHRVNGLGYVIAAGLLVRFVVDRVVEVMNLRVLRYHPPPELADTYDDERFRLAQRYLYDNSRFGWVSDGAFLLILFGFWFGGGFAALDGWVRSAALHPVLEGVVFIAVLAGGWWALSLPFQIFHTFVIEERHGFNRATPALFATDQIKTLLLSILLGVPLLSAIVAIFLRAGAHAWLWCWIAAGLYVMTVQTLAPTWILPLFNRFEPLVDGRLRRELFRYVRSIRFPLENVFVMDGSKRSDKSNAFFIGFGRRRRIVLLDTLVRDLSVSELVAVVAHEAGHAKRRHLFWMTALIMARIGCWLFVFSLVMRYEVLYRAFGVATISVQAGLVFFCLLLAPLDLFTGPAIHALSRRNEREADGFAAATTGDPQALISALKKLSSRNLGNPNPHPCMVRRRYSHPPILERIANIRADRNTSARETVEPQGVAPDAAPCRERKGSE